jgi:hypothetical protein
MSSSALQIWCNDARKLLGEEGRVYNEKWGELRAREDDVVDGIISRSTWDTIVNSLEDTTDLGKKDKIILDLGKSLAVRKALFGDTDFTAEQLVQLEPVADKFIEVASTYPQAINAGGDKNEGKLGDLRKIEELGGERVEEIKAESKRLDRKLKDAIRTDKSATNAYETLEEYEQWLEGLAALNGDFSRIRPKYSDVQTWGRVNATDLVMLARTEKHVVAAQTEYTSEALPAVRENRDREGRGSNRRYFVSKVERLEAQYVNWKNCWEKLTNIFTRIDPTEAEGLAGIEAVLADAWDLASSDEYLNADEGLQAMKADCDLKWQAFANAGPVVRPGLRGVVASEKVQQLNSGRTWKRSYRIGDGVYRLSVSRSAGTSFKRDIPPNLLIGTHPHIRSFIYHLQAYED